MANTTVSPNMGLPVPTVGVDPSPDWATNLNASLLIIDSHDHAAGQGVPVTPAGLNINSDLTLAQNNLTNARSLRFTPEASPLALSGDLGCLYESGVDLWYNDGSGNQVRITQSGSVTGAAGTITGLPSGTASASYSGGTFTFQSATSTPATLAVGPLVVGASVANAKTVTIAPPNTLAADYDLNLPGSLPATTSLMTLDSSGNISVTTVGTIAGLPSGTASASFSGSTFTFLSATSTPATLQTGPLVIGNVVSSSNTVTLKPPTALAASYTLTFPGALPSGTSVLTLDASGNVAPTTALTVDSAFIGGTGLSPRFKLYRTTGTLTASQQVDILTSGQYTNFFGCFGLASGSGGTTLQYGIGQGPTAGAPPGVYLFVPSGPGAGSISVANTDSTRGNIYDITLIYF